MLTDVHVGEDGWLFLTGGEPAVVDLYRADSAFTPSMAVAWVELLRQRADQLSSRGISYMHVTAPDKLTLLNRHYNGQLEDINGSPIQQLQARHVFELPNFLNVVPYLSRQIDKYPVFWKTDSHWTAWGCYMAYQLVCSKLGMATNNDILNYPYSEHVAVQGLGRAGRTEAADGVEPETVRTYRLDRFSRRVHANQVVRYRENMHLDNLALRLLEGDAEMLSLHDTLMAGEGSHVIYENHDSSAADKVIVLFGDSYSDFRPHLLTSMLAETAREVHFVWSDAIDHEYVRQVRPDCVITQSSEVNMMSVPEDTGDVRSWADARLNSLEQAVALAQGKGIAINAPVVSGLRVRRTELLGKETYQLNPPSMVQAGCDTAHQELAMQSNSVSLVDLDQCRLYFNGERCLLRAANEHVVLRYDVDAEREERVRREDYLPIKGCSFLLAPTPGAHCYYHWMLDILPKLGLLERQGIALDSIDHFLVRELTGKFQLETLARFGIDSSRVVETIDNQYLLCENLLHIDMHNGINMKMNKFVPLWVKQVFLTESKKTERLRLYISRPSGVRRGILNEAQMKPLLEAAGFTTVVMEGMSVIEQAALLSQADVLMGPHGGALTNMVFCKPGIQVVELMSRHVFPFYYGLAELCGHRYHAILENPQEDFPRLVNCRIAQTYSALQNQTQNESFTVDLGALEKMLAKLPAIVPAQSFA